MAKASRFFHVVCEMTGRAKKRALRKMRKHDREKDRQKGRVWPKTH